MLVLDGGRIRMKSGGRGRSKDSGVDLVDRLLYFGFLSGTGKVGFALHMGVGRNALCLQFSMRGNEWMKGVPEYGSEFVTSMNCKHRNSLGDLAYQSDLI